MQQQKALVLKKTPNPPVILSINLKDQRIIEKRYVVGKHESNRRYIIVIYLNYDKRNLRKYAKYYFPLFHINYAMYVYSLLILKKQHKSIDQKEI